MIAGIFDSEPEVCRAAAEALARIGDPAVSMGPLNFLINTQSDQPATDRSNFAEPSYLATEPEFVEPERRVEDPTFVRGAETADVAGEIVAGLTSMLPEERVEALAKLTESGAKEIFKLIVNSFADVSPDVRNAAARALYELDPDHVRNHSVALSKRALRSRAETLVWPWPRRSAVCQLIRACWFATVVVMSERSPEQIDEQIRELLDSLYRVDSGRILATLIRLLGDFDLAEEAMHEAFAAALSVWPRSGVPDNPRPWLISTARFKAIDTLRRRARFDASQDELVRYLEAQLSSAETSNEEDHLEDGFEDDRLRLMFTCCHPALPPEARVALTLREVCGLTTEEIAKAFLITPRTLAQRIVRAKAKIRDTPIPYEVPSPQELPERLGAVLQVIYLVFNEGYSAAAGAEVMRADLTGEAIRLGRLLAELQPEPEVPEPEVIGLLSLMLLQESRHSARTSPTGELILLENQDRSLWNREQIAEGLALLRKALKSRRFGSYTLQAAIAAVHAEAESVVATDWRQIVALYDRLLRIQPSPVVQLNRAVAIAECDGPEAGLRQIDALLEHGELANYYLAHSARADMYRRLGRTAEARSSYETALALTQQEPERQFLKERIRQLK